MLCKCSGHAHPLAVDTDWHQHSFNERRNVMMQNVFFTDETPVMWLCQSLQTSCSLYTCSVAAKDSTSTEAMYAAPMSYRRSDVFCQQCNSRSEIQYILFSSSKDTVQQTEERSPFNCRRYNCRQSAQATLLSVLSNPLLQCSHMVMVIL